MRVLAIDQTTEPAKDSRTIVGAVVTLEIPQGDIEVMARAKAQGNVVLALHSYADIVAADKPAVVTVTTEVSVPQDQANQSPDGGMPPEEFFRRFFDQNGPMPPGFPQLPGQGGGGQEAPPQKAMALGSGFIVGADGTVVTNNHVVENATKITVKLDDGTELTAKLIGTDAKNDIAVLKVEPKGKLPTIAWGDSDALRLGDPVVAIGDPFGIGTTVTAGIVSARGRDLHNGPYDDFIQVDAAINHGNSGGPLVDVQGRVVGITTAILPFAQGLGFAIPASAVLDAIGQITAAHRESIARGTLGISGLDVPIDEEVQRALSLEQKRGVLLLDVAPGGAAARASLQSGDMILALGDRTTDSVDALRQAVQELHGRSPWQVAFLREGRRRRVPLMPTA